MLSNKDIRVEGSNLIINGEKHPIVQDVSVIEGDIEDIKSDLTIRDVGSQATYDLSVVQEFNAYTYGKLVYIHLKLKAGIADQQNVVTNLPFTVKGNYGVLPMFFMNAADATSNGVCTVVGNNIQYRGTAITSGSGGTVYSGMFFVDDTI